MTADTYTDAFRQGYQLGFDTGHGIGHARGYERRSLEVTAVMTGVRQALGGPTQIELDQARSTLRNCACDRCAACLRRRQIDYNRRVYGQDDYPGLSRAREILTELARERRAAA